MKKCECGCGQEVTKESNRFICGHHSRGKISWNKGKKRSEETRKKISKSKKGKNKGKHHSEETKRKISEGNKGKKYSEETRKKMSLNHADILGKNNPRYGIPLSKEVKRRLSESRKGENNPNWRGGLSFIPYCNKFNEELKEKIRDRDNRICQNCGKTEIENGKRLSIHHIHYDKENCYPDLICLCVTCNNIANCNRNDWEKYYMKILEKRKLLNYDKEFKNLPL